MSAEQRVHQDGKGNHVLRSIIGAALTLIAMLVTAASAPASDVITAPKPIHPVAVTASASSHSSAPSNAVDDDLISAWRSSSNHGPQWLKLDLGREYALSKVQQTFADNDLWSFVIEGSIDGHRWVPLVDKSAGEPGRTFAESVNGTYRYVRLRVLDSKLGYHASSLDFEAVGTLGVEDLAQGRPATASSFIDGYPPPAALDGNTSTYWVANSGALPQWLTVDLGRPHDVFAVEQDFKDQDTWRFKIEGSLDNQQWTTIADHTDGIEGQSFHEPAHGTFRYVRMTLTGSASGYWAASTSLKVLGPPSGDMRRRNLAPGVRAESTSLVPGHEPFDAVDADPATSWQASDTTTPQSVTVDLGNRALIDTVEQTFPQDDDWKFTVEASRDARAWTMLADHRDGAHGRSFDVSAGAEQYRYLRVTIDGPSASGSPPAIDDLKVLGIGSPVRTRWFEDRSGVARFFPIFQHLRLDDITAQLDTLKAQGFNAVELTPVFEGNPDVFAGLAVTNLYNVDPSIGTFEDLRELIAAAHRRDMNVLFFANPGYAHDTAPFFQKALRDFAAGVDSPERCWFDIRPEPGPYDRWVHNEQYNAWYWARWDDHAPSFNFARQCWRDEVKKYIRFWMAKGFDGMVFDAPDVYHQTTVALNNEAITDVMRNYDTFINGEGMRQRGDITDWHYNSLQDYSLTQWAVPPDPGSSRILDAIDSGNPDGLENVLKAYRDEMVSAGGITQTPPNWGRRDYPVDKRLLEIATLTTVGTLFYIHNDYFTINPYELDFPHWTQDQLNRLYALIKIQSSYDALSPSGLRFKLPTNDNSKYYAFVRSNKDGSVKALVVLNFQASTQRVTVDLSNVGIDAQQTPIDLVRDEPGPRVTSSRYTIEVPAYGARVLAVN